MPPLKVPARLDAAGDGLGRKVLHSRGGNRRDAGAGEVTRGVENSSGLRSGRVDAAARIDADIKSGKTLRAGGTGCNESQND